MKLQALGECKFSKESYQKQSVILFEIDYLFSGKYAILNTSTGFVDSLSSSYHSRMSQIILEYSRSFQTVPDHSRIFTLFQNVLYQSIMSQIILEWSKIRVRNRVATNNLNYSVFKQLRPNSIICIWSICDFQKIIRIPEELSLNTEQF